MYLYFFVNHVPKFKYSPWKDKVRGDGGSRFFQN